LQEGVGRFIYINYIKIPITFRKQLKKSEDRGHGARSMEHGAWSKEHGAWRMAHGAEVSS